MPPTNATELYRDARGRTAVVTYTATARGHTVELRGPAPHKYRTRFLDLDNARLALGVLRLKLRLDGYERAEAA